MNRLSWRASQRCEDAREPACRCRCNGTLHGAKRGSVASLPLGDPHSIRRKCVKCQDGTYHYAGGTLSMRCPWCLGLGYKLPKEPATLAERPRFAVPPVPAEDAALPFA